MSALATSTTAIMGPPPPRFPTGFTYHLCPTCKKWGHNIHVSQGKPDPKWECAEHTGEGLCMICCEPASSSPTAEGWFCNQHKYRPPVTAAQQEILKIGKEYYETLEAKAKRVLGAGKKTGIKKAYLQIRMKRAPSYSSYDSVHLYEWKLRTPKQRKFVQKLVRNIVAPGEDRTKLFFPYENLDDKVLQYCQSWRKEASIVPDDAVIFSNINVVMGNDKPN